MGNVRNSRVSAEQAVARCRELARVSDVAGQTTRTFLSVATREAQALVSGWMRDAGLAVTVDGIGNLHGVTADAGEKPRLIVASHIDTVVDAGAFDGPLGVVLGLALIEASDVASLPFAIELIAFSEEEGVRFRQPFLGSLALIGEPVSSELVDANGVSLAEAVAAFGLGDAVTFPATAFAYLEFHIEQGPVLEAEGRALAAVSGIAGQSRMRLTFTGHANHAGTTPMGLRHDALAAAAHWITAVESYAKGEPGLVATVGSVETVPGLGNVVPGRVTASLDVRHAEDGIRHDAVQTLLLAAHAAAGQRGVTCTAEVLVDQAAVPMDAGLTELLVESARAVGWDGSPMLSGAGHDAMIVARRLPSAMLFLRTPGGLSHHPEETVLVEDVESALGTGLEFLRRLTPGGMTCTS
jgi:allantoate deiminase